MSVDVMEPGVGQIWKRKKDGVLIAIRRNPELSGYSFTYVQNLRSGRHFEVTAAGIRVKYEFVGYDHSDGASMQRESAKHVWKLDDRGEPEMFELGSDEDMDDGHYCVVCEEYYSRFSADHDAGCPGRPASMQRESERTDG